MPKRENPLGRFQTEEAGEIARQLVVGISKAIGDAAGAAAKTLRVQSPEPQDPSLKHEILRALHDGPLSAVPLRKKVSVAMNGKLPQQTEFKTALESLVSEGLIVSEKAGERELYTITSEGQAYLPVSDSKGFEFPNLGHSSEAFETLKAAQRLAGLVIEVATNGTNAQRMSAAKALEETRARIIEILADK